MNVNRAVTTAAANRGKPLCRAAANDVAAWCGWLHGRRRWSGGRAHKVRVGAVDIILAPNLVPRSRSQPHRPSVVELAGV
jgi:hypothetical protein